MMNNSCRYYECSLRKNEDIKCTARLTIKNNKFITSGKHQHGKSATELDEVKKEIDISLPCETTRVIKKRIVKK